MKENIVGHERNNEENVDSTSNLIKSGTFK